MARAERRAPNTSTSLLLALSVTTLTVVSAYWASGSAIAAGHPPAQTPSYWSGAPKQAADASPASRARPATSGAPTRHPSGERGRWSVRVVTVPRGATVHNGRELLGRSPLTIRIPEDDIWILRFSRPGYLSRVEAVPAQSTEMRVVLRPAPEAPPPPAPPPIDSPHRPCAAIPCEGWDR